MNDIFKAYDFENEQQWLKGRMNGIGGSDASAVVGMNPYKSNIDLFEEKIGRVIPKDISDKPCVIYGKKAEEYIRELFKLDYPEYQVEHHEFRILQSKDHPFMQASLDGELTDQEGRKGILEIKTTRALCTCVCLYSLSFASISSVGKCLCTFTPGTNGHLWCLQFIPRIPSGSP